jgi:hypothetical protein
LTKEFIVSTKTFSLTLMAFAVATLTACGGGGGGSDSTAAAPAPVAGTPTAPTTPVTPPVGGTPSDPVIAPVTPPAMTAPVKVKLTQLDLRASDTLVKTAPKSATVASLATKFMKNLMFKAVPSSTAFAAGLPSLDPGQNTGFTNAVRGGMITRLNPVLVAADGTSTINCDLSTAEVIVNKLWMLDDTNGHMLANMTVPDTVTTNCTVTYRTADFVVTGNGRVGEAAVGTDTITDVMPAHDEAFNTSDSALLIYSSGQFRVLDIDAATGASTLTALTSTDAGINTALGMYTYNGTYLVGLSKNPAQKATMIYKKNDTAFKYFVFDWYSQVTGYWATAEGDIIQNAFAWGEKKIDPVAGTYTQVTPFSVWDWTPQPCAATPDATCNMANPQTPPAGTLVNTDITNPKYAPGPGYNWIMTDRCTLWNRKTAEIYWIRGAADYHGSNVQYYGDFAQYSRTAGQYAYCVDATAQNFYRYDIDGKKQVQFNLASLGLFPVAGQFTMYNDHAVIEVVNTANSDKMYAELNFATGAYTPGKVISNGDRQVVEIIKVLN